MTWSGSKRRMSIGRRLTVEFAGSTIQTAGEVPDWVAPTVALLRDGADVATVARAAGMSTRTVQRQVVELLRSLQTKYNLTYLFISHDLAVVKALSHQLMVVKQGKVVEQGPAEQVFAAPQHPYTRQLLEAAFMAPATTD